MLSRFQDLNTKILPLMEDYLIALRSRDNTPASLLRMDKDHEEEMINNYTSDMKSRIQGTLVLKSFYTPASVNEWNECQCDPPTNSRHSGLFVGLPKFGSQLNDIIGISGLSIPGRGRRRRSIGDCYLDSIAVCSALCYPVNKYCPGINKPLTSIGRCISLL